ncbi:Crp/Fnr family transcriptional regulator [Actinomadura sp. 7K507]|uniref:Crp/Fnr family transcriptional regulator n=1 Tax=Actinomadura sp. 7K507 TaxID=2530365 RepID=UPI0010461613|nr:Crp/Fnr family transcriptional regulator [Actinomadura sp. 7K507]TDC91981.1 Crp/Fnr family transcriptional regulator [Actinomadura sp. 7K507]
MPEGTSHQGGRGRGPADASSLRRGFWFALDSEQRAALGEAARSRSYAPGSPLVHQGDESNDVTIIEDGWAKVTSTTEDGHDVVLAVRGPGDLIAESVVLGGRTRSATVTALSPLRALMFPAARFTAFLKFHPEAWRLVSGTFVQRLDEADRRLEAHLTSTGTQRLALLLVDLAEESALRSPAGADGSIDIAPTLSQTEIGSWVDASRETVARGLALLRRRGLVRTGRRKITVVDQHALRAFAQGIPTASHHDDH